MFLQTKISYGRESRGGCLRVLLDNIVFFFELQRAGFPRAKVNNIDSKVFRGLPALLVHHHPCLS